jgi:hypothetical protein
MDLRVLAMAILDQRSNTRKLKFHEYNQIIDRVQMEFSVEKMPTKGIKMTE